MKKLVRTAIALILALGATPTLAEECRYVSGHDLGALRFFEDGTARLELIGEPVEECRVEFGDDGGDLLVCADDISLFNFASPAPGEGDGKELLALWDHVWYRQC